MSEPVNSRTGIESGVTLYHPYLEFHSLAWLKQTLLMWDTVRRIVPAGFRPKDDDEVIAAADAGAVLNTPPESYVGRAAERFETCWVPSRTRMLLAATEDATSRIRNGNMGAQVGLWRGKLSDRLAQRLERDGVLRQEGEWYRVDGRCAGLYMTCLASTMAESIGVTCCTDRPFLQMNSRFFCRTAATSDTPAERWLSLGLKLPTLEGIASVPMKDILAFREKNLESRRALRIIISNVCDALSSCDDQNAAQDIIRAEGARIQSQLDDHRQRLSDFNVRAVTTFFRIDRPATAVTIAALAAAPDGLSKTLAVCAGFALGFADWWVDLRTEYRDLTRANPWHYLTTLADRFGGSA